jgi:hypothetical protein
LSAVAKPGVSGYGVGAVGFQDSKGNMQVQAISRSTSGWRAVRRVEGSQGPKNDRCGMLRLLPRRKHSIPEITSGRGFVVLVSTYQ